MHPTGGKMSDLVAYFNHLAETVLEKHRQGKITDGDLRMIMRPMELITRDIPEVIINYTTAVRTKDGLELTGISVQEMCDIPIKETNLDTKTIKWLVREMGILYVGELFRFAIFHKNTQSKHAKNVYMWLQDMGLLFLLDSKPQWKPPYFNDKNLIESLQVSFKYSRRPNIPDWKKLKELEQYKHVGYLVTFKTCESIRAGIYINYWLDDEGNFNPNKISE